MLKSYGMLMDELKTYASAKSKLTRLIKNGSVIQLRRGLYATDTSVSREVVAASLYGPSYVSFQYALAISALIPERAYAVTSAAYHKNKNKAFKTPLGEFFYYCLPDAVYPYGITMRDAEDGSYLIASPEKALCDMVYRIPAAVTSESIESLLLEDLRIDETELANLDAAFIKWIAPRYGRKSLSALSQWFERNNAK